MNNHESDVLDALTDYRPLDATIEADWSYPSRKATLEQILTELPNAGPAMTRRPRIRRRYVIATIGVTAAGTLAAIGGIVLPANSPGGPEAAIAAPFQRLQNAALRDPQPVVGPGQFAYVASAAYTVRGSKLSKDAAISKDWTAANGDHWDWHREAGRTSCFSSTLRGTRTFGNADQGFFNKLPTDSTALATYMRSHVIGSSSRDEAVFVAVEDLLRTAGGLASPELRAALIGVLAQTDHVTVREDVRDVLNRAATRVDFEDQGRRPGERNSLYFDPSTSQLVQVEASSTDGAGQGDVDVMTTQKVVDALPDSMKSCKDAGI